MHLGFTVQAADISIHALREEGDSKMYGRTVNDNDFYPRPPRGGRPGQSRPECGRGRISIHALREEGDNLLHEWYHGGANFYPRPPRGGRRRCHRCPAHGWQISIHALREEGDAAAQKLQLPAGRFLSTPSARRATRPDCPGKLVHRISIHALREEGDDGTAHAGKLPAYFYPRPPRGGRRKCRPFHGRRKDFYPRPPRGGRPRQQNRGKRTGIFLSTPSARRATPDRHRVQRSNRISIHALREEGDGVAMITMTPVTHFYPRPPRGGRLLLSSMPMHPKQFLSTPSARRATRLRPRSAFVQKFLSTPSARRATRRHRH